MVGRVEIPHHHLCPKLCRGYEVITVGCLGSLTSNPSNIGSGNKNPHAQDSGSQFLACIKRGAISSAPEESHQSDPCFYIRGLLGTMGSQCG